MGLFGFGKKKQTSCGCSTPVEEKKDDKVYNEKGEKMAMCGCGSMCRVADIEAEKAANGKLTVKVLGSGCKKCNDLEAATIEALDELGLKAEIEHVTDFTLIANYGVMSTPALVVNEKVISMGKVLKKDEVIALMKNLK